MSMAMAAKQWTVDQIRALPDDGVRREIIDGELWMSPASSWDHQRVAIALQRRLAEYVEREEIGELLAAPADVVFDRGTAVQPDIFVVPLARGPRPSSFEEAGRLLLAVEVLSPSTARLDRGAKRELYQQRAISEYWIVDPDARLVERWTPADRRPEIVKRTLTWQPDAAHAAFALELPAFFAAVLGA